jgi:hypothetical protein
MASRAAARACVELEQLRLPQVLQWAALEGSSVREHNEFACLCSQGNDLWVEAN